MSKWVWDESKHRFSETFISESIEKTTIVAAFDQELRYMFLNPAACKHMNAEPESLLGKSIIDVYPDIIASRNHRNLLRALEGEVIHDIIEGRFGHRMESHYEPVFEKNA